MTSFYIKLNKSFVGRQHERQNLSEISASKGAAIIATYGRRRIGKTELLEQAFRTRHLIKLEGIEGKSNKEQMQSVLLQFSKQIEAPLVAKIKPENWTEVFEVIASFILKGTWTLYFEEVQWLANYLSEFISEFKYVWDNQLRHNPQLIVIFCGSSPSFVLGNIVKSKALYNRSLYEIPLKEFSLSEAKIFLGNKSNREVLDAYLSVGGIPEYLKWLKKGPSVFLSLCKNSFTAGGFFSHEYERIFVSQLASNRNYRKIIEFLSKRHFATRSEILKHIHVASGGTTTDLLLDLEQCEFIQRYAPFDKPQNSLLARFCINDAYLQFYFKFIKPIERNIDAGVYNQNPSFALNADTYRKWLGFAFERLCRKQHALIAKILGFGAIQYQAGPFFSRTTDQELSGFQIDLVFDRADQVYTICEIKYQQTKVNTSVIADFERKLALFPNVKNKTIQKVLIATEGAEASVIQKGYFDRIITTEDLFL